jgi:hypothetical protein
LWPLLPLEIKGMGVKCYSFASAAWHYRADLIDSIIRGAGVTGGDVGDVGDDFPSYSDARLKPPLF